MILWAIAASAAFVAFLAGRHAGWLEGFRNCQGRGLYGKGYDRGWRDHQEFIRKGGSDLSTATARGTSGTGPGA